MSLRSPLVAASICVGCLLSGCTGGQDKKIEPARLGDKTPPTETRPGADKKSDPKKSKESPPKVEDEKPEPKQAKELAKTTVEAWEKRGFTAGWMGANPAGVVVFAEQPKDLRDAMPSFRARQTTDDAALKGLPPAELPFGLMLGNTKVSDAGLKELANLPNLAALDLGSIKLTNAGLSALAGLNLVSLEIRSTEVTDAGLKSLAGLTRLTYLGLGNIEVTDAGLKDLAGLKNLTSLNLSLTKATDAGRKELQAALPKCVIVK